MDSKVLAESQAPVGRTRSAPRRVAVLLAGVALLAAFAVTGYAPLLRWWTASRGEHLTLAQARGRVLLDLPEGASDIRFYQRSLPDRVLVLDFAITEDAFLRWAARQGWKPEPIVGSVTIWPRSAFGDRSTVVTVRDGYCYHTLQRGVPNTFSVTYDRATGRAYYQFSSEPLVEEG